MSNIWVGHSKLKPIDVYKLFVRKVIINGLGYISNNNYKTEATVVAK